MREAASARGVLPAGTFTSKRHVRDAIVALHGDTVWQALQGYVYGAGINSATLYPGVLEFLARAKEARRDVRIISHKTQYGHFDATRTDLRAAARRFLKLRGVGDFISDQEIIFCATRAEKLARIRAAEVEVFVDDLEDILTDAKFPATTKAVHFAVDGYGESPDLMHCRSWSELSAAVFDPVYESR